jgi:hypothetical protein
MVATKKELLEILHEIEEKSKEEGTGFIRLSEFGLESNSDMCLGDLVESMLEEK